MNKAYKIKKPDNFRGEAWLFRMEPPYMGHDYVIVSAIDPYRTHNPVLDSLPGMNDPETYIFSARPDGTVKDWHELPGSFAGDKDIPRALRNAGYEIVEVV
jgi:hypothetical protein